MIARKIRTVWIILLIVCTGCLPQNSSATPFPMDTASTAVKATPSRIPANTFPPAPTVEPPPAPTSYINESLGFTLEFPASWAGRYLIHEYENGVAVNFLGDSDIGRHGLDGNKEITGTEFFDIQADLPGYPLDGEMDVSLIGVIDGISFFYVTSTDHALGVMDLESDSVAQADYQLAMQLKGEVPDLLKTFRALPPNVASPSDPINVASRLTLPRTDQVQGMLSTDDGGVLLLGQVSGINSNTMYEWAAWAQMIDAEGKQTWCFESSGTFPCLYDAAPSLDGGYLLLGYENSCTTVIKVNETGEEQWRRQYGRQVWDYCTSIVAARDGGFLLVGQAGDPQAVDDVGLAMRMDAQGNILWMRTYEEVGVVRFRDALTRNDGGYVLIGDAAGTGTYDGWAGRIDDRGDVVWQNRYNGAENERLTSIADAKNGYLLCGCIMARNSYDQEAAWALKIDETGGVLWETVVRENAEFRGVCPTDDGGAILVGNRPEEKTGTHFRYAWIVRLDAEGAVLWERPLEEKLGCVAQGIVPARNGEFRVGGGTAYSSRSGGYASMGWLVGVR